MRTWENLTILLSEKRKVQVDVCANLEKLAIMRNSTDQLHVYILPKCSDTEERCEAARADITVKWRTAKDEYQEATFSVHHKFAVENPAEWRLRLDGYLPLLEDTYVEEDTNEAGIITVSVKEDRRRQRLRMPAVHPILSGKVKVEEEVLPVSKELLAAHSQYFSALFYGGFKEKNMEVVEIQVDLEPFKNILQIVRDHKWKTDFPANWGFIMKVADGLEMIDIVKKCESNLRKYEFDEDSDIFSYQALLPICDFMRNRQLTMHILKSFRTPSALRDVITPLIGTVSSETTATAFQRLAMIGDFWRTPSKGLNRKVWFVDPVFGELRFKLFHTQVPDVSSAFVRLFCNVDCKRERELGVQADATGEDRDYSMSDDWRTHTTMQVKRDSFDGEWLLFTHDARSFCITKERYTNGIFFGKLVYGSENLQVDASERCVKTVAVTESGDFV